MTKIQLFTRFAGFAAGLCASTLAHADDVGLYGDAVPGDAVFIRWLDHDDPIVRTAFAFDFSDADVPTDTYVAASATLLEGAESGAHYSVLRTDDGAVHVLQEPARDDASKVHLFLLNAGAAPITLHLPEADVEVIGATGTLEANGRAVNPISVALTIQKDGSGDVIGQFEMALRRGQNMSFALLGDDIVAIPSAYGQVVLGDE